jgi:hypothetical protein
MSAGVPLVLSALFGGVNLPQYGEFFQLAEGVAILPLYGRGPRGESPERGPSAAFLRYSPGASVPAHEHPGYEHILILEGSQRDERGVYPRGTCLVSPPGTRHSVVSDEGCLALAIWNEPVEFVDPPGAASAE